MREHKGLLHQALHSGLYALAIMHDVESVKPTSSRTSRNKVTCTSDFSSSLTCICRSLLENCIFFFQTNGFTLYYKLTRVGTDVLLSLFLPFPVCFNNCSHFFILWQLTTCVQLRRDIISC